jgi:hypothetical protein
MIIFIPQDENKSCIYRKKTWNFPFTFSSFLTLQFGTLHFKFCVFAKFRRKKSVKVWKTYCGEKIYSENKESKNTHFISSIFH